MTGEIHPEQPNVPEVLGHAGRYLGAVGLVAAGILIERVTAQDIIGNSIAVAGLGFLYYSLKAARRENT